MGQTEETLIAKIRAMFPAAPVPVGIGDDCAVLEVDGRLAVTTDTLVENVDFTRGMPFELIGRKSLSVNLSDLAAMGATPHSFVMTLVLPRDLVDSAEALLAGIAARATRYRIALVGGDLSSGALVTISITAFGQFPPNQRPLLRSGARKGDRLFVTRALGGSAAGLLLLQKGWRVEASGAVMPPDDPSFVFSYEQRELASSAIRHHAAPEPECEAGMILGRLDEVSSCIDISDGLSLDLDRLCRASLVGAVVESERVPIMQDLSRLGRGLGIDAERAALHGGEEYALLFTSSLRESRLSEALGRPVYQIGRITEEREVLLDKGGRIEPLAPQGLDHFAG